MGKRKKIAERVMTLMDKPQFIRNIGIVAHIDHGKTTLSDNLLGGAGMISMDLAGKQLFMDFDPLEQARGITIDAANVSMVHEVDGKEYLINMIDTPGHVDFGGDVTRAMRAVDGAVVVVDAVEGAMPQTETVLRQALKEGVRPVLFVNKVDRMINELKVEKKDMAARLGKVIDNVNKLILGMDEEKYKAGWKLDAAKGNIAFGSALYNWAISVPQMKKTGIGFDQVVDYCHEGKMKELAEKVPLYIAVNDMVVKFLPSPIEAQKERVGVIWHGDWDSPVGKAMASCDPNGPVAFMINKVKVDPHAGEVATGRLFSGTLRRGMELYVSGFGGTNRIQQTGVVMGAERVEVEEIPAGNIAAVTGLRDAIVGSTLSSEENMTPFEQIKHVSEPVMTVAVEAKNTRDLPKVVEVLRQIAKEDPTLQVTINEETGEHLMAGMGELHLEIIVDRMMREYKVEAKVGKPQVSYRETIRKPVKAVGIYKKQTGGRGQYGHVVIELQPLEPGDGYEFVDKIVGGAVPKEYIPPVDEGIREAAKNGILAGFEVMDFRATLVDGSYHEVDSSEIAFKIAGSMAFKEAMKNASPVLLEPIMAVEVHVPDDYLGDVMGNLNSRRGHIEGTTLRGGVQVIRAATPLSEMFGYATDLRSRTQGRGTFTMQFSHYSEVPKSIAEKIVGS